VSESPANQPRKRRDRPRNWPSAALVAPFRRYAWQTATYRALSLIQLLGLASHRGAQVRLGMVWLALTLKEKLGLLGGSGFRVDYEYEGHRLSHRVWDRSELDVVTEVFVARQYEPAADPGARVVLDLGSNIGVSVLYFHLRCPEAVIVGVEPAPETFRRLKTNTQHLPRVRLINAAVAGEAGVAHLYSSGLSWEASLHPRDELSTRTDVPAVTADGAMASLGLRRADVIKVDIEGAEAEVLSTAEIVRSARAIVFEYHAEYADASVFDLIARLPEFSVVRIDGSSAGHALVTLRRDVEE
jgi:FkbM family methyltransferase